MDAGQETTQPIPAGAGRGAAAFRELVPGDMVGEYQIERKLGQGAMGAVYAAIHPIIEKRVALKLLRRELCANRDMINRFIQEARAVNRIGHRNIVDVFGFGRAPDGRAFLAMELLAGDSLATHIARYGALPIPDAVAVLTEISHALEAAHRCGIVHRDLKPDNVFLAQDRDGRRVIKLLDFGIAKLLGGGPSAQRAAGGGRIDGTLPGTTMGTPKYIAPEQAQGHAIDGSADIYALGVMAFEMLTGQLPFTSTSALDLIAQHIGKPPPIPSTMARLPSIADRMLLAMLDKQPANRPSLARVRALLDDVATRCAGMPVYSSPLPRTTGELVAVVQRRRWPWIAGAGVALALAIGGGRWIAEASEAAACPPQLDLPAPVAAPRAAVAYERAPAPRKPRAR